MDFVWGLGCASATPVLMAALFLACLANFAAYPLTGGLLPHVVREVYRVDQAGLGTLFACFSGGAVLGSLLVSLRGVGPQPARVMLVSAASWFALLLVFAHVETAVIGMALLMLTGFLQSLCMVPMSVLILRITAAAFRGRIMGLRMLAIGWHWRAALSPAMTVEARVWRRRHALARRALGSAMRFSGGRLSARRHRWTTIQRRSPIVR